MKSKTPFFLRSPPVVFSAGICYEYPSFQENTISGIRDRCALDTLTQIDAERIASDDGEGLFGRSKRRRRS